MDEIFNLFKQKDKRQKIEKYKIDKYFFDNYLKVVLKLFKNKESLELWNINIPVDSLTYIYSLTKFSKKYKYSLFFFTNNIEAKNTLSFNFNYGAYYIFIILLKLQYNNIFFPVDMVYYSKLKTNNLTVNISSYTTNNYYKFLFNFSNKPLNLQSISNIYSSFTWVERELSESNNINFLNLKDSRRLLSDYNLFKTDTNSYNTNSYNILTQDIYIVN